MHGGVQHSRATPGRIAQAHPASEL